MWITLEGNKYTLNKKSQALFVYVTKIISNKNMYKEVNIFLFGNVLIFESVWIVYIWDYMYVCIVIMNKICNFGFEKLSLFQKRTKNTKFFI